MFITQTLRRAIQTNAKGTATICGERNQTWAQLQERAARWPMPAWPTARYSRPTWGMSTVIPPVANGHFTRSE